MGIKVKTSVYSDVDRAIRLHVDKVERNLIRKTQQTVKTMLELATLHTPKMSGDATRSWEVSFNGPAKLGKFKASPVTEVVYEHGMYDAKAFALNKSVVASEYSRVSKVVSDYVKFKKSFNIHLTNTARHSQLWLDDPSGSAREFLRAVNEDYYTYRDIEADLKIRMKYGG